MNHAVKATFLGLMVGLLSAIESFLLSLPVVYYMSPQRKPVSEFSGLGVLGELVMAGTTVALVMFLVSFIVVVRYHRSENQKAVWRVMMSLLASVATFFVAAVVLGNRSFGLLWAIGLSAVVLIGASAIMIRHRSLGLRL